MEIRWTPLPDPRLDGGNCCLKDGQVYGRTHAQPASHESFSAVKELAANLGNLLQDVQVFGENMQVGIWNWNVLPQIWAGLMALDSDL